MKIPMTFDGVHYRGSDYGFCVFCGEPIRYEWVIYENQTGDKITLCERHYKKWEQERDMALTSVSAKFRAALNALNDGN